MCAAPRRQLSPHNPFVVGLSLGSIKGDVRTYEHTHTLLILTHLSYYLSLVSLTKTYAKHILILTLELGLGLKTRGELTVFFIISA